MMDHDNGTELQGMKTLDRLTNAYDWAWSDTILIVLLLILSGDVYRLIFPSTDVKASQSGTLRRRLDPSISTSATMGRYV